MVEKNNTKVLWTVRAICEHCDISKDFFYRLVKAGKFPATIIEGRWCAHTDNIEEFFRLGTKTPPRDPNMEAE